MKNITLIAAGLLLVASPAFADSYAYEGQTTWGNSVGNSYYGGWTNAGNGGISSSAVTNASGVINQDINVGAASNVGSATALSSGGTDASYSDGTKVSYVPASVAVLSQATVGNGVGNISLGGGSATSAYTNGVSNLGVNGSTGIINQNVNSGIASNVGSAVAVSAR